VQGAVPEVPRHKGVCTAAEKVRGMPSRKTCMPPLAEILCQRCGALTEAVIFHGRPSVGSCPCGGMRQVVRIIHHRGSEPPASEQQVEQSFRHRSDEVERAHRH
jgi:hypothetical protein